MNPLEIRPLTHLDRERLRELMSGYVTTQRYAVQKQETDAVTTFTLTLQPLPQPYSKNYWDSLSEDDLERYAALLAEGLSLGAYMQDEWVGVALAEAQPWNRVLNVWELHVHPQHRGAGIGRRLVEELAVRTRAAGLRALRWKHRTPTWRPSASTAALALPSKASTCHTIRIQISKTAKLPSS